MTKIMSASRARENIFSLIDETAATHEPIIITGRKNNAVMISQEDWDAIKETLYLGANADIRESIIEGLNTPVSECSDKIEW